MYRGAAAGEAAKEMFNDKPQLVHPSPSHRSRQAITPCRDVEMKSPPDDDMTSPGAAATEDAAKEMFNDKPQSVHPSPSHHSLQATAPCRDVEIKSPHDMQSPQ